MRMVRGKASVGSCRSCLWLPIALGERGQVRFQPGHKGGGGAYVLHGGVGGRCGFGLSAKGVCASWGCRGQVCFGLGTRGGGGAGVLHGSVGGRYGFGLGTRRVIHASWGFRGQVWLEPGPGGGGGGGLAGTDKRQEHMRPACVSASPLPQAVCLCDHSSFPLIACACRSLLGQSGDPTHPVTLLPTPSCISLPPSCRSV